MDTDAARAPRPTMAPDEGPDALALRLLGEQLGRMRGMLFGYSERFFERIRTWTLVTLVLLVVGSTDIAPAAIVAVPFLVPFAFLETGYLFFHTVFARRHAEYLEREINRRLGRDLLVAHRLEAAYFYDPAAPKLAAFSFGRPLGMMSVMTVGYTVGAGLLWIVGMLGLAGWVEGVDHQFAFFPDEAPWVLGALVPAAIAWTVVIAAYLAWTFLTGYDEQRLLAELDAAYGTGEHDPDPTPD